MSDNYQMLQSFLLGQCCCPQNATTSSMPAFNLKLPPNDEFISPKEKWYQNMISLLSIFFEWPLQYFLDEHLLITKVKTIPTTFSSLEEYYDSFKWPLIEEVRANVHQSLGQIYEAPLISLRYEGEEHVKEGSFKQMVFSWESNINSFQPAEVIYSNPRPQDLILLCTVEPGKVKQSQGFCMLALVKSGFLDYEEAGEGKKLIEVLIHKNQKPLFDENLGWYAIYLSSFGTAFRIWNSLNSVTYVNPYSVIQDTLKFRTQITGPENASVDTDDIYKYIFKYCADIKMNESQRNTVTQIAFPLLKPKSSGVNMIQGPPGTGKTSTVITLLSVLSCLDVKCLVCAPTNIAVATVALRFMQLLGSKASFFEYHRTSTDNKNINIKLINLCDLILVGDKDKILIHNDLKDIYLPYRAKCLFECLVSSKNWRYAASSLLDFLISAVSHYEIYLEQASQSENEKLLTFLQFMRKSLTTVVENLIESIDVLVLHLPSVVVNKNKFMAISILARQLLQFVENTNIPDVKLRELFGDDSFHQNDSLMGTQNPVQMFLASKRSLMKHLKDILKETEGLVSVVRSVGAIEDLCLKNSSIVFCTVSSSGCKSVKELKSFDCAIIDEAAQLVEAESCIVTEFRLKCLVLVGDHKQLPATVISKVAKESDYGRSLFERLQTLQFPSHFLDTQYRMHPEISIFPRVEFYERFLKDGENVTGESYTKMYQHLYGPYGFIDVADGTEERDETTRSIKNVVEANVVVYMANQLNDVCARNNISDLNVGIITPYKSQVQLITELFEERRTLDHIIIKIKSVDGFQGQEEDVIIFSTVRSNRKNIIGFVEDTRRLNVALTRARYCMWVVGNAKTLTQADIVWKKLVLDAKKRGCFVDPSVHHGLKRIIVKSKEQLNQMEDLLKMDSILFKNALWKVIFSDKFKHTIARLKPISNRLQLLSTILNIANGLHQRQKILDVPGLELFGEIINIQKVAGLCLVWTIDVERGELVQQIIKIWDAVSFSNITSLIKCLNGAFFTYSATYLERCKSRHISRINRKVVLPSTWKPNRDLIWYKSPIYQSPEGGSEENSNVENGKQGDSEKNSVSESLLLMKFYSFATASINQILAANDGSEIAFPFEISEHEREIVQYPLSCFIIGRSGTGKTTVLISKLHQREQGFRILQHGTNTDEAVQGNNIPTDYPLRQLLVTLNPKLCTAIKFQLSQIQSSLNQDNTIATEEPDFEDEDDVNESIPDTFTNLAESFYPMVITYKKFLRMLDGSVPSPFFTHNISSIPHRTHELSPDPELKDSNSNSDSDSDSLDEIESQERKYMPKTREEESVSATKKVFGREMDFAYFCSKYWPHFNSRLTKKFDPSQVYAEIISSIKGSIQAMKSEKGRLSRDSYLDISETRSSSFSREERNEIYKLFLQYEDQRMVANDYDVSDHVFHLYRQLHNGAFLGDKIHFVYIDEVQDLTQSQIALFSYICEDSSLGFTFAGDTAQTITKGVNFRFQDLASLFFKEFCKHDKPIAALNDPENLDTIPANAIITKREKKVEECVGQAVKLLQLTHNFRTHIGVVRIANSIVDMLYYFFPYTIDRLLPETSRVCGERPVLLNADQENFFEVLFGWGREEKTECAFGAQQAIIVRNENQKNEILKHLGTKSLVLTIDGCKGLEFEDVLLYNFFLESPLKTKWRVLYQYTSEKNYDENFANAYPTFDAGKHSLLCSELKHLYVGVTRARRRLWIYDKNASPILEHWIHANYMQEKQLDESFISSIQVASTPEEWRKRGTQLFNEQQYDMAMLSFERAGDTHLFQWAKAANLQQEGEKTFERDHNGAIELLQQAAEIFQELGKAESAAKCYIRLEDYKQAGKLYLGKCNPPKFKEAGDCFAKAMLWMEAASAYSSAKSFKECLDICLNGKMIETSLEYIEKWKGLAYLTATSATSNESVWLIIDAHLKKCAVHCHQRQNVSLMLRCVNMFSDISLKRSFLLRRDYIDELIEVEKAAGFFSEAAKLAEAKGDIPQTTELYMKAGNHEKALCNILISARQSVLWGDKNPGWPPTSSERSLGILQKVRDVIEQAKLEVKDQQEGICERLQLAELEMEILEYNGGDIPILRRLLMEAEEKKNFRLQVLAAWKAIDVCIDILNTSERPADNSLLQFKNSMEKNLASLAQEMLHIWNTWKQKLQLFIDALGKLKRKNANFEDERLLGFSFEHFGVEYGYHSAICIVNDSEAKWLEGHKVSIYRLQGTKGQLRIEKFAELAAGSWERHLSELSRKVYKCVEHYVKRGLHCLPNLSQISNLHKDQKYLTLEKGSLLLDLYGIAEKMECFKEAKSLLAKLQLEIQSMIFPKVRQFEDMVGVRKLRDDPRAIAILGKLAYNLIEVATSNRTRLTLDETCRLQMILPLLNTFDYKKIPQFSISLCHKIWENDILWDQYRIQDGQVGILKFLLAFSQAIGSMFHFVEWKNDKGYVTPFVFLSFVETSSVMALSYFSRLHGLILPRSLAVDLLASKSQHKFYTRLLAIKKSSFGEIISLIEETVDFCVQFLLRDVRGTQDWVSKLDSKEQFPNFVLRALVLLLTLHVNMKVSLPINKRIIVSLQNIFISKSPILAGLPVQLSVLLHKMIKDIGKAVKVDVEGLFQALESIGDSLIMTKRCEKGHCCKSICSRIETIEVEDDGGVFVFLQEEYTEKNEVIIQNSESHLEERESIMLPHVVVLGENTDYGMIREEVDEGGITNVKITEEEPLTDLERFKSEAETFLCQEDGCGTRAYLDYFVSHACPLKADLLDFSQKLGITIPKLKGMKNKCNDSDELLDELMDTNDGLVKDIKLLDPRDDSHQKRNIQWLEETMKQVNERFDLYKKTMKKLQDERLRNLLDENEELMVDEIHEGSCTQTISSKKESNCSKSTTVSKKRPQKNKKKGRNKKR